VFFFPPPIVRLSSVTFHPGIWMISCLSFFFGSGPIDFGTLPSNDAIVPFRVAGDTQSLGFHRRLRWLH